jgi:hypothetical protein
MTRAQIVNDVEEAHRAWRQAFDLGASRGARDEGYNAWRQARERLRAYDLSVAVGEVAVDRSVRDRAGNPGDPCETMQTNIWVDRMERRAGTELARASLSEAQRSAIRRIKESAHDAMSDFYVPKDARVSCHGRIRPDYAGGRARDRAGRSGPRVTDTNLYVLQEVADAVELYGAPVRRFSPTSAPHLRRLIGFGLLERVGLAGLPGSSTIGERVGFHADPRAPGWAPSAAGYAALEERRRAYPALAAATGLRDPDPERRERYVRMLRQEMQP